MGIYRYTIPRKHSLVPIMEPQSDRSYSIGGSVILAGQVVLDRSHTGAEHLLKEGIKKRTFRFHISFTSVTSKVNSSAGSQQQYRMAAMPRGHESILNNHRNYHTIKCALSI